MRLQWILLSTLFLLQAACGSLGHRVAVDPGPSWLRPWQRPYSVDGERYVPLQAADGYREEGLASWYGSEEHGGLTSNGEVFDMYRLTAAHKTLPLGCRIRVTNKVNGRQAVVRVNDRGPFVSGRIVDLSYQAARELDMLGSGLVPVLVEVVPDASEPVPSTAVVGKFGTYTLQVAAFADREMARLTAERLGQDRLPTAIQTAQTSAGLVYRVRVGKFRSRTEAEAARLALAGNGYPDAFIISE